MREYLEGQDALPADSLEAGVPVSIKREGEDEGNQVGFILCPLHTEERRPLVRLRRIMRVMSQAKSNLRGMSRTAAQDYTNMLMMPTILLTLTGRASQVRPALNVGAAVPRRGVARGHLPLVGGDRRHGHQYHGGQLRQETLRGDHELSHWAVGDR